MSKWTAEEIEVVKGLYGSSTAREISLKLRRSLKSVEKKIFLLGIRKRKSFRKGERWKKEEDEILKRTYAFKLKNEIFKLLSNRDWDSIRRRAWKLKLKRPNKLIYPPTVNVNLSEGAKGYLAGLLDGEGSLYVAPDRVELPIYNTDKRIVEHCRELLKTGRIKRRKKVRREWKPQYVFILSNGADVYLVLKMISKYLIAKKRFAEGVISYLEMKLNRPHSEVTDKELTLHTELREKFMPKAKRKGEVKI